MKLVKAEIYKFRSINTNQSVDIDAQVTAFVGMNEAGKTVFLRALNKTNDALGLDEFKPVDDYPRKDYTAYMRKHASDPEVAVFLEYLLDDEEVAEVNRLFNTKLESGFVFGVKHKYNNSRQIQISVAEAPVISWLAKTKGLSSDAVAVVQASKSLREIVKNLEGAELTEVDKTFLKEVSDRVEETSWDNVVEYEVWNKLSKKIPKFLYFSDYDILPGKLNLADLASKIEASKQAATAENRLSPKHKAVRALLRMADVESADFAASVGYEEMKAKVEAVSISLTDQVLEYWKQNEELEVEVDIKEDPKDEAPFNNGPNLYLRIKNKRHRGVSTPFDQRSRGFIWFFSFLVWFDSVREQLDKPGVAKNLVLLLDEPGLALHALAQSDFLAYIDTLSKEHQVLYTTHSPFMVHSDRLHQVRMVEDKDRIGTVISANLSGSDQRTIFPLQAALGWNVAQNLFIGKRNVIVEGPSELMYLQSVSSITEALGENALRGDITIVPVGGLTNVVTFVSLLGANGLKLAVLHDYNGRPDQKLEEIIKLKILNQKSVFNASQFRDVSNLGKNTVSSDVEDLIDLGIYIDYFNKTFAKELGGNLLKESDLPQGDRIVERIERWLVEKGVQIRPSGGYNHYAVAVTFASSPPKQISSEMVQRFVGLFDALNKAVH
jgi:predicted ATP-dependent endonuclease of OLD family